MSGYTEVTVVCDGAHESEETFEGFDTAALDAYLASEKVSADEAKASTGVETEIYVLEHEHDQDGEECACVQYLTDHAPIWSNVEE